ncbi:MAG: ABC transporter ATP-binding protein, partial [Lactimicrobium massiliense]|nr:ABC transporter ATP-binding protein [Lactimicrobium massiliense]
LDEPTNDLDTDTLTILESFLQDFPGAVLAVSHDRYFLDRIAERLFVFNNGTIEIHQESYSDYLDAQAAEKSEEKEKNKEVRKVSAPKPSNRLSYMEKKELEKLEKEIPGAEQNVRDLEEQLNNATDYPEIQKISADLETARSQMDEMEERWMELSEKAEN